MPTGLFDDIVGGQGTNTTTGLFDDLIPKKKTKEQVAAEVGQAQAARDVQYPPETMGMVDKAAELAYWPTRVLSRIDPVTALTDAAFAGQENRAMLPTIPPEAIKSALRYSAIAPNSQDSVMAGVQDFVANSASGMSSPHAVMGLMSGRVNPALPAVTFAPPMVTSIPQTMDALYGAENPAQYTEQGLNLASQILFPPALARGETVPGRSGLRPGDIADTRNPIYDRPGGGDLIGPERQLPMPGQGPTVPMGSPLDRPAGAARFGVDPSGRVIDLSQLTPLEQTEAYRGPKEFVPREAYVRPAQEAPVVLGEQKPSRIREIQIEQPKIIESATSFVPRQDVAGGQVSFAAPAEARAIPSARQSALDIQRPVIEEAPTKIVPPVEESGLVTKQKPIDSEKNLPDWAREEMLKRGLDPARTFNDVDLQNPSVIEAIKSDPTLTSEQKTRLLQSGSIKQKPEVAKLSTSTMKNPLGDPMGTTYHATPEDWGSWQKVQTDFKDLLAKGAEFDGPEMMKVRQENENIKNRYGGMPPQPPKGGIGEGLKAAVEKNQEAGSVYNFFRSKNPVKEAQTSKEVVNDFTPLPSVEKVKEMIKPLGAGNLPFVGSKIDPRKAEMNSPQGQALISHYKSTQVGDAMSSLVLTTAANKYGRTPFEPAKTPGMVKLQNGKEVFLSDALESYFAGEDVGFSGKEKAAADHARKLIQDAAQFAKAEGVKKFMEAGGDEIDLTQPYFHRSALGKIKREQALMEGQSLVRNKKAIGSERGIQKGRRFKDQQMAWEKEGIVYDNDLWSVTGDYLKQIYRAVADERLAKDPAMKGETEAKFMETALSYHPAFKGRKFNAEAIEKIHHYLEDHPNKWVKQVDNFVRFSKAIQFGADFATSMNQLLSLPFRNPQAAGKSVGIGVKALFDENATGKWLSKPENNVIAKRLAEAGVDVVQLAEFVSDVKKGGVKDPAQSEIGFQLKKMAADPNQYPIIKQSNRAMAAQFAVAKVELGKAFWPLVEKGELTKQEWGELITDMTGTTVTQGMGITPSRAIGERLLMNSPSIIRSTANALVDALNPKAGKKGVEARKNLASLYIGTAALTSAALYSLYQSGEISEEEFKERMKPTNMTVPVKIGDQILNVGFGGTFIAVGKMLARTAEQAGQPGSVLDVEDKTFQPLKGFATGRMSTIAQLAKNVVTGQDYKGDPIAAWEAVLASFTPVGAQAFYEDKKQKAGTQAASFAIQSLGLQTSPENIGQKKRRLEFEAGKERYGVGAQADLNTTQRALVQQKAEKVMSQENLSARDRANAGRRAMEAAAQRERRVSSFLSGESKALLEVSGLNVPQLKPQGKTDSRYYNLEGKLNQLPVKFNRQEQEMFEERFGTELNRRLELVLKDGAKKISKDRFEAITRSVKEMVVNQIQQGINAEAARRSEERRSRPEQR